MPKNKKPATIHDVAKLAGVAVGSASRALNNVKDVTTDIRERTLAAARTLNYTRLRRRPERGLTAHRDAPTIAVICFGMDESLMQLPSVSAAVHSAETAVSEEGGTFIFTSIPRGDRVPPFLAEGKVAGVILKGPNQGDLPTAEENELVRALYRVPRVWMMGRLDQALGDHVNFDTVMAGRLAAQYVADRGHKRVAFLNPKPGHAQFEYIKRGFCDLSRTLGAEVDVLEPENFPRPQWPLPGMTSQERVDELARRWHAMPKNRRASVIMVGSDMTAMQLYSAFGRLSVQVGRDVGVVSCNDERAFVAGLHPGLTTIDVRADEVGRNAVARLLWLIERPPQPSTVKILVEPRLVERASVPQL